MEAGGAYEIDRIPGRIARIVVAANIVGAAIVYLYLQFLAPGATSAEKVHGPGGFYVSSAVLVVYLVVSAVVGVRWIRSSALSNTTWLDELRPPSSAEARNILAVPTRITVFSAGAWAGAAVIFGFLNVAFGHTALYVVRIVVGIFLGGLVTSAITHPLAERYMRPAFVLVLAGEPGTWRRTRAIRVRLLRAWVLGSAMPLAAIILTLVGRNANQRADITLPVVFLALVGLGAGFVFTRTTAVSIGDPLTAVRRALDAVRTGDLTVHVPVDDPGEIGMLESGVNRMVEGLRERKVLEDLFGRHVGEEVARHAVEQGVRLGGEQRQVSVLFVDLIGSTRLASTRPASEVVSVLNTLFGCVVDVISEDGGWVNKFEGDAALCIFGAPAPQHDHPTRVLRAARRLRLTLAAAERSHPGLDVAIGVSSGTAVAGNVGALDRYEYTVVGDPVNEAARLTDLAKTEPGRLLASAQVLELADPAEALRWRSAGEVTLRGRDVPTSLMVPVWERDPAEAAESSDGQAQSPAASPATN